MLELKVQPDGRLQQMSAHILKQTTGLPGAVRAVYRCLTQHWNFKYARAYIPQPRQMTFTWFSQEKFFA